MPENHPTPSSLLHGLAAGDSQAFASLYDRLATRMFNTALAMTGSIPASEDAVHDVFVELARSRHGLARVADLDAYVFTMLRHAISRQYRRCSIDRRALARLKQDRVDAGRIAEQPAGLPDDALAAALSRLPVVQREVVALKIDGGLTFAEIATVLGKSINTVASRYRAAVEKLRASVAPPETA